MIQVKVFADTAFGGFASVEKQANNFLSTIDPEKVVVVTPSLGSVGHQEDLIEIYQSFSITVVYRAD
ncbi:sporulation protein Cse60 [Hoeflea alexandrii]|uniref:Uncharacterized protein n=1 Tax=Hoeflea alexandrii TaxID=288436 RepID=A0ABT1CPN4_9HYPH|nr:hypothetical protein [Hoeflea alexandrii]MCO6407346.1 hypothetical protein [Hoeflea alexandrii]MCY0154257.1 hypothetical protein [Hoeflea alexandrii]